MRRKVVLTVTAIFGIVISVVVIQVIRAVQEMAWKNGAEANIDRFAKAIEIYKSDNDKYPASFSELLLHSRSELTNHLNEVERLDRFHNKFECRPLTNGFVISATRPETWFLKGDRLEKTYKAGESPH